MRERHQIFGPHVRVSLPMSAASAFNPRWMVIFTFDSDMQYRTAVSATLLPSSFTAAIVRRVTSRKREEDTSWFLSDVGGRDVKFGGRAEYRDLRWTAGPVPFDKALRRR